MNMDSSLLMKQIMKVMVRWKFFMKIMTLIIKRLVGVKQFQIIRNIQKPLWTEQCAV